MRLSSLLGRAAIPLAALIALAACAGRTEEGTGPAAGTPASIRYLPEILSTDLAAGQNRFVVGLIDQQENRIVLGAQLHFRFFKLDGEEETLRFETDATPVRISRTYSHTHRDGTQETHQAGTVAVYLASVEFDSPGDWAVEVSGSVEGEPIQPVTFPLIVREESLSPAIGQEAPRSVQRTLSDVADIGEICTDSDPIPEMHRITIAQAVTSGRPTVIAFVTPAFCLSRICGPTKDVVNELYRHYGDRVNFIHVEPYDLEKARSGEALDPLPFVEEEWGLETQPWVFIVDGQGNITAKFEAVVSYGELEAALLPLLGP